MRLVLLYSTKVYHTKLHQSGKQSNPFFVFSLGTISIALPIHPNFEGKSPLLTCKHMHYHRILVVQTLCLEQ